MEYIAYHQILNQGEKFDLQKTNKIYWMFYKELKNFDIKFFNFNHYDRDNKTKEFTIRFQYEDSKAHEKAIEISEILKKTGEFYDYRITRQLVDEPNPEPIKAAHEFMSKCVIELIKHQEFYEEMKQRLLPFVIYFFKIIFQEFYDFDIGDIYIKPYIEDKKLKEKIDNIIKPCLKFAPKNKEYYQDPRFVERCIHLFHNCTYIQYKNVIQMDFEDLSTYQIMCSNFFRLTAKSYKK